MPFDPSALRPLGWRDDSPAAHAAGDPPAGANAVVARVVAQHRSGYEVALDREHRLRVRAPIAWARPRFDASERAAVGDWVWIDPEQAQLLACLPRHSLLRRGAAGEHYRQQLIAANIDNVLVVCGLDRDFNPRRIERYLLLISGSGASPVVVLSKADLSPDPAAAIAVVRALIGPEVPVLALDGKDARIAETLAPWLGPGRSVVLVGSSGAGKSTLSNTLLGSEHMRTGEVRGSDSRGRHTTTYRTLLPLPQGGVLIDTPGMRELKLAGDERIDDTGFEDVRALAERCRFRDCRHAQEPGCAVRAAIESGQIDAGHVASFLKLSGELHDAGAQLALRQAQKAEARVQNKALRKRLVDKYGRPL